VKTSYADNVSLINGLWQNFAPSDDLRDLFRETFSRLDQEVFRQAIKQVRQDTDTAWPSVRNLLDAYRVLWQRRGGRRPAAATQRLPRTVIPAVDVARERLLITEYEQLIDHADDENFYRLESDILDRYDAHAFSSHSAYTLLRRLRARVFGGPGLSQVTREGGLKPLAVEVSFEPRRSTSTNAQDDDGPRQADRQAAPRVELHPRRPAEDPPGVRVSPDRAAVRLERPERGGEPLPAIAGEGLGHVAARAGELDHPDARVARERRRDTDNPRGPGGSPQRPSSGAVRG
jgi:hypothetical protein